VESPPPPTQQQAAEAQQARYVAEAAILSLFLSSEEGGGGGENESSLLHAIKIATILAALSTAVTTTSFRAPGDRSKSLLLSKPDHERIGDKLLSEAQYEFHTLEASELEDKQKAVLWATWAYSRVADEIASAVNNGEIEHEFSERGLKLKKIWISRSDSRVRPLHANLPGKTISTDKDFWRWPHTGHRLRWPGDKNAPPDAVIGCRCVCLLSFASQAAISNTIRRIVDHTAPS
jgi:hypothetical protein